jgi:hypothetical protein
MSNKWRRYLYLLVDRFDHGNYALRRIDASTLFFPTTNHKNIAPAAATATAGIEDARLPRPFISFTASPASDCGSRVLDFFTLFGRGKNKSLIAGADENGFTFICDLRQQTVYNQRRLNEPKQFPSPSGTRSTSWSGGRSCPSTAAAASNPSCTTESHPPSTRRISSRTGAAAAAAICA